MPSNSWKFVRAVQKVGKGQALPETYQIRVKLRGQTGETLYKNVANCRNSVLKRVEREFELALGGS
jgi:hypothetical protein